MPWMAAGMVAAPIIGGLIGNMQANKDRKAQKQAMAAALKQLEAVGMPPDLSKQVMLQQFQQAGIYTPELEEDLNSSVPESEVAKIKEDAELRDAQKQALAALQSRSKVGLSAEDRAALNQVRSEVQRDAEAKRQQILQSMAARGQGSSGASLMAQLQSAQGASDQAAAGSDQLMAQAQQRALAALGQAGQMAGQVRGQDFSVNQTKAAAQDERNRFLAQNSIARQQRNVGSQNQAQQYNLGNQQRLSEMNIAQTNNEKLRQNQAQRDLFQDKLQLAAAKSGQYQQQANYAGQQAQNTAQMYSNIGGAIGQGIGAYGQSQAQANQQGQYAAANGLTQDANGNWIKGK